jgi:carbonic anhydrase
MFPKRQKTTPVIAGLAITLFCGASGTPSPQTALQELKAGNQRYVSGHASHCNVDQKTRASLQSSQRPNAVVLSCSDSRLPPEQVFDQGLGDLFTIRVAGNVLNEDVIASIEYAVANLGSQLIVVMGHESCGAIKAALSKSTDHEAGSPNINHLTQEIRDNLGQFKSTDPLFQDAAKKNVSAVADQLIRRSKIVREGVKSGKLKIAQAYYSLDSGKVEFAD